MKVFLDLDGTLVDFVTPAMGLNGVPPSVAYKHPRVGFDIVKACNILRESIGLLPVIDKQFWENLDSSAFWENLKFYAGAVEFVEWLERKHDVYITTCSTLSPNSSFGKHAWVAQNLPRLSRKLFICKQKYLLAGPGRVLIDDSDENCQDFVAFGGKSLLVPRPWNMYMDYCDYETLKGMFNEVSLRA